MYVGTALNLLLAQRLLLGLSLEFICASTCYVGVMTFGLVKN